MTEVSLESLNALLAAGEKLKRLLQDKATAEKAVEILDKLIIETAAELVAAYCEGEEKSEMPCNCHCSDQVKNFNQFIHDAVECVWKQYDMAAIMIVPVSVFLAADGDIPFQE